MTLQPGESKVVSFEATPQEARSYQVSVNGLTGSFVATEALEPVPCVYCRATFGTEAELISHTESNHPGKPYLVSMQLLRSFLSQGSYDGAPADVKVYVPDSGYYQFHFWIYSDACASAASVKDLPAGFYEKRASILSYGVSYGYFFVPPGTYAIKTSCVLIVGYELKWLYRGVDTGLTIRVV